MDRGARMISDAVAGIAGSDVAPVLVVERDREVEVDAFLWRLFPVQEQAQRGGVGQLQLGAAWPRDLSETGRWLVGGYGEIDQPSINDGTRERTLARGTRHELATSRGDDRRDR